MLSNFSIVISTVFPGTNVVLVVLTISNLESLESKTISFGLVSSDFILILGWINNCFKEESQQFVIILNVSSVIGAPPISWLTSEVISV